MTTRAADRRLGVRLALGLVAVGAFVVPFLLLWLLVEDRWSPLERLDRDVARSLNNAVWGHPAVIDLLKAVSIVFHPDVFRVVCVVLAVWLIRRHRVRVALFALVAVFGGSVLDGAAKVLAHRHRPLLDHPVASSPGYSFPSGHALGSVVGVAMLLVVFGPSLSQRGRRWAQAAAGVVVVAVGFSRIGLGVHYLSDVVGGWVLGAAWVLVSMAALATWRHEMSDVGRGAEPGIP